MSKKIIISIIAAAIIAIIAIGLIWRQTGQEKTEAPKTSGEAIKLAVNVWPGYAYAFVAKEKGFFERNGVNVELILKENYGDAQELYVSGQVDGVLEVFSDTITHNIQGIPTKAVYVFDYSDDGDVIIGKGEYNDLSELKGGKIGVDGINSFSHIFVETALKNSGLNDSDFEIVDVSALDLLDALESGKVDAGHTWEPIRSQSFAKGYKQLGKAGDYAGLITDILAFRSDVIDKRPNDIQAVVKSLVEAKKFVSAHQEEVLAIMSEAEGMSKEEMSAGIEGVHLLDLRDNKTAFSYDAGFESLHGVARRINNFMKERGVADRSIDSAELVDARFITAIKK